jgi:hypothetical protein
MCIILLNPTEVFLKGIVILMLQLRTAAGRIERKQLAKSKEGRAKIIL